LEEKNNLAILKDAIHSYILQVKDKRLIFDIIPADEKLIDIGEDQLRHTLKLYRLRQILSNLKSEYDYILIDSPPNWRFLSQTAIYAADVLLIPTKHNNIFSLENAAIAIKNFIPQIQQIRKDGGPIALPIFFNGEKITEAQESTTHQAIDNIIEQAGKDKDNKFDLLPYFYPRSTQNRRDRHIFELPSYAHIANAAFSHLPAAYKNKIARDYYLALVKEYFLQ
ncbi:MAG: ParA family protein, partial [Rhizonema sp. NSF051]|nr:ParA family protein [Rhizonema sp. NSF051]